MKKDIHPKYNGQVKATCECGAEFLVGSTKEGITTEICSNCHPFYTGKTKLVDTAGRVEKFRAAQEKAKKETAKNKAKASDEEDEEIEEVAETPEEEVAPEKTETPDEEEAPEEEIAEAA